MNLKLNGLILIIGVLAGAFSAYKLMPKPLPQVITKTDVKTKIVRIVQPDGKIIETTEQQAISNTIAIVKKKYGVGVYSNKSIFGEIRLSDLPLFLIADTNFKEHKVGIKLEF